MFGYVRRINLYWTNGEILICIQNPSRWLWNLFVTLCKGFWFLVDFLIFSLDFYYLLWSVFKPEKPVSPVVFTFNFLYACVLFGLPFLWNSDSVINSDLVIKNTFKQSYWQCNRIHLVVRVLTFLTATFPLILYFIRSCSPHGILRTN